MSLYHPTLGEQWWLNRIANGGVPGHWGHPGDDDRDQEPGRPGRDGAVIPMTIVLDIQSAMARYQRHRAGHARAGRPPAAGCPVCRELWAAWMAAAARWGREDADPARLAEAYAWQAARLAQDPREYVPARLLAG